MNMLESVASATAMTKCRQNYNLHLLYNHCFLNLDLLLLLKPEIPQHLITNVGGEVHVILLTVNSDRPK